MLTEGNVGTLGLLILFVAFILYWIRRSETGRPPSYIRRLPALDAIDEGIGRAVEMGGSVIWAPSQMGNMTGSGSGPVLASISIMSYIVDKCIEKGTRFIGVINAPEDHAYVSELLAEKYKAAGRLDMYKQEDIIYAPGESFHVSCINAVYERGVVTTFWIGSHSAAAVMLSETGAIAGCFQVSWTADAANTAYFVMNCDYALISEEGYGAAAYLSNEPVLLGSLAGEDIAKFLVIGLLTLGSILLSFNVSIITNLLGM